MKKIYTLSLLLLSSAIVTAGCGNDKSDAAQNKNVSLVMEDAFSEIEAMYKKEGKFEISSINEVSFSGNKRSDVLVISQSDEYSKVEIFSYNQEDKKWSSIYLNDEHENFNGLENLKLIDKIALDGREQLVIGYEGGNANTLNFEILSYDESFDTAEVVLDKMFNEFTGSMVSFEDNMVSIESDSEVYENYIWQSDKYVLEQEKTGN